MSILEIKGPIRLSAPQLVFAVSGWVDGGHVATKTGEHFAEDGQIVGRFQPDALYNYGSNRPTVEFSDGAVDQVHWPALTLTATTITGKDLIVVTGREPDFGWEQAADELAQVADAARVQRIVSIGAVPASVPHTRATPIMTTSTDASLPAVGLPPGRLVVPASFVNVAAHTVAEANQIPEVGFWGQVPHYVSGVYWPGVEAILKHLVGFLDIETDLTQVAFEADQMIQRLDEAVADNPEAQEFLRRLETAAPGFDLTDTDLVEEVETFLKQVGDDDNPF